MVNLIKEYSKKRLDLLKLEATEKSSLTIGIIIIIGLLLVFGLFFLVLLNIGLGFLIGSYLGNYAYGFLIISGFYLLLIVIILLTKNSIKNSIASKIIKLLNE